MSTPTLKKIPRRRFETSGWRTIVIARGIVQWPDGRQSSYNVRLQARPGEDGDVQLIASDVSGATDRNKTVRLRRAKGHWPSALVPPAQ